MEASGKRRESSRIGGLLLCGSAVVTGALVLLAASWPGFHYPTLLLGIVPMLFISAAVWLFCLVRAQTGKLTLCWPFFFVGPLLGLIVIAAVAVNAPMRLRFAAAQDSFESVAAELSPGGNFSNPVPVSGIISVGTFSTPRVVQAGDAVIFHTGTSDNDAISRSLLCDAGFAYLPSGPDDRVADGGHGPPSFTDLGDDWYSFGQSC